MAEFGVDTAILCVAIARIIDDKFTASSSVFFTGFRLLNIGQVFLSVPSARYILILFPRHHCYQRTSFWNDWILENYHWKQ